MAKGANWKDEPHPTDPQLRVYTASDGMHYEASPGDWQDCAPGWTSEDAETVASRATQFPVEFKRTGRAVRLQDPVSGEWLRIEPQGVSVPTLMETFEKITLGGLWANTDLEIISKSQQLKTWYVLTAAGHPTEFEWEVFPHPSSPEPVVTSDGGVAFGEIAFKNTWVESLGGEIREGTLSWRKQGNRYFITVGMPDLTGLSYPIRVDPTTSFGAANDGFIGRQWLGGQIWSEIRNWGCNVAVQGLNWCHIQNNGTSVDEWIRIRRVVLPFDTSGLPDSATVLSADLEVYPEDVYLQNPTATHELILLDYTGAVPPTTADCANIGSTEFGSADFSGASPGVKFTIALNAAGLSDISKTGNTDLALRHWNDHNNVQPGRPSGSNIDGLFFSESGGGGTYAGPALVIEYTTAVSAEITEDASVRVSLPNEVIEVGSLDVALNQQMYSTGSVHVSLQVPIYGEVFLDMSAEPLMNVDFRAEPIDE